MKKIIFIVVISNSLLILFFLGGKSLDYLDLSNLFSQILYVFCALSFVLAPVLSLMNMLNLYQYKISFKKKIIWYILGSLPMLIIFIFLVFIINVSL